MCLSSFQEGCWRRTSCAFSPQSNLGSPAELPKALCKLMATLSIHLFVMPTFVLHYGWAGLALPGTGCDLCCSFNSIHDSGCPLFSPSIQDTFGGFSGSPAVKTLCLHCGKHGISLARGWGWESKAQGFQMPQSLLSMLIDILPFIDFPVAVSTPLKKKNIFLLFIFLVINSFRNTSFNQSSHAQSEHFSLFLYHKS